MSAIMALFILLISACSTPGKPTSSLTPMQTAKVEIRPSEVSTDSPENNPVYLLLVAEMALHQGQTDLAVQNYLSLAKSQNNSEIAERAVRVAIYARQFDAAIVTAKRWIELAPEDDEARQILASIYIRRNDSTEAFIYLDEIISSKSGEMQKKTLVKLMGILAREKNTKTVLEVAKKIADKYQHNAYAAYLYGMLAAQANKPKLALMFLDNALAIQDIPGAHSNRAKMLIKLGRREEALVSLHQAVLNNPNHQKLRLTYARLLVDLKQFDAARKEFEELNQIAPDDADLLYSLALLTMESKQLDSAEKYLRRLLELKKHLSESRYYLGRINESRKNHQQAISWYEQVESGEYQFDARLRAARLLAESGQLQQARDKLKNMADASQSKASLVRIYLTHGEILRIAKEYHAAMDVYDLSLKIVPGNTDLLYARALTGENIGRVDILERDILVILKTEPDNAYALNAIGFTLADRTDRIDEAYAYLKRAITITPDDPAIIDSFGWVNYRMGNFTEAVRLLRKALSGQEDAEIAAHLGEVLWVSGETGEAKQVWRKALQKTPDDHFLQQVMQRYIP